LSDKVTEFTILVTAPYQSLQRGLRCSIRRSGDPLETVKALIVANQFLETELEKLRAAVSTGYARGKLSVAAKTVPRDRKDWYD
jgi:hypothetical protein